VPQVARIRAVLDIYGAAAGGLLANGLAFSSLFAAIPTTLLILAVAGWLTNDLAVRQVVADAISNAFPPLADLVDESLEAISAGAALTSIVGVIGLIWTVSQLYGALDVAFARIYSNNPERDIIRRTARGLLVVAILIIAIVGLIVLATVASAFEAVDPGRNPALASVTGLIGSIPFLTALSVLAVLVVYRTLPPRAPGWRPVIVPAIVVGIAVVILSQVFMFLVPRLVGVAALAGSLASAFIALAWLSFGFQALLYGAAWVRVRDEWGRPNGLGGLGRPAAPAELGGGGE
jgi:membrane protein